MGNSKRKDVIREIVKEMNERQNMGPFPNMDSEILADYNNKLEEGAIDYDNEPVLACPICNSIALWGEDELMCLKCGNPVLEENLVTYKTIYKYLEANESSNDKNGS